MFKFIAVATASFILCGTVAFAADTDTTLRDFSVLFRQEVSAISPCYEATTAFKSAAHAKNVNDFVAATEIGMKSCKESGDALLKLQIPASLSKSDLVTTSIKELAVAQYSTAKAFYFIALDIKTIIDTNKSNPDLMKKASEEANISSAATNKAGEDLYHGMISLGVTSDQIYNAIRVAKETPVSEKVA